MLPDYPLLLLFLSSVVFINLIPGADVLFVTSQSLVSRKQGILAVLGISTGVAIYIMATAFGLAEIFRHSEIFFNIIKIIGVIYLLYLAWQALIKSIDINTSNQQPALHAFSKGILTNLLNPKVGLFFLTFLPQFVNTSKGHVGLQLLSLGLCFIVSGTIVNLIYAFAFIQLKERIFSKAWVQKWLNKFTALVFCLLALKVLTARQS